MAAPSSQLAMLAPPDTRARNLRPTASILASSLSACFAVLFTNIPETLKTRLQLDGEVAGRPKQYTGLLDAAIKVWRQEGLRGLQSGLSAGLAYQAVMNGVRLGMYEPVQRAVSRGAGYNHDVELPLVLKAVCAAASGGLGAFLGSPLYLIKSRLQAQSPYFTVADPHHYTGLLDGLRQEYAGGGVRGLWRGLDGALPRVMTGSAVQLTSYDAAKHFASERLGCAPGFPTFLVGSLLASVITVTAMNPLDVVSTRLYQSAGISTSYSGPLDCARQTVRREGLSALQKGWVAQYSRLGPHTVLTFLALEQVKPLFMRVDALTAPG